MTTKISTKLAALAAALTMNGLIVAGVAHMFQVPSELRAALSERHIADTADSGRRGRCTCPTAGQYGCPCAATSQL